MFCACDRSQVLKKMFNITNYKAAPYSTLSFWATKTARSRFVIDTRGWSEENYVVANTECTEIETGRAISLLLDFAVTNTTSAATALSFVQLQKYDRGDVTLEIGEWIAFKHKDDKHWQLGLVVDLLLLKFGSVEEFYMRCGKLVNLRNMEFDVDINSVKVPLAAESDEVCLHVNHLVSMCDVHADVQGDCVILTYYD